MAFAPSDAPGNLPIWLEGDQGTWQDSALTTPALPDDLFGGWVHQGSIANNGLQATAGKRTTLKQLSNGTSSFRGARYSGATDLAFNVAAHASLELTGDFHLYVLAQVSGGSTGIVFMHGVSAAGLHITYEMRVQAGTLFRMEIVHGDNATFETIVGDSTNTLSVFHVLEWRREGTAITFWCDGVQVGGGTQALANWANVGAGAYIGNRQSNDTAFTGDIAAILFYDQAHNEFWRTRVEAYLTGIGGTTLPAGAVARYGLFGKRTRSNRTERHYQDLSRRWQGVAADSVTGTDSDRLETADTGHYWYKWSGSADVPEPFRRSGGHILPVTALTVAGWAGLPMGLADVYIQARYTHLDSSEEGAGLCFRVDLDGNGWIVHFEDDDHWWVSQIALNTTADPYVATITHWEDLGASGAPVAGVRTTIRLSLYGLTLKFYVNGTQIGGTVTLSTRGQNASIHGIFAHGNNVNAWDNVRIWPKTRA